jgi:hypothetical protein
MRPLFDYIWHSLLMMGMYKKNIWNSRATRKGFRYCRDLVRHQLHAHVCPKILKTACWKNFSHHIYNVVINFCRMSFPFVRQIPNKWVLNFDMLWNIVMWTGFSIQTTPQLLSEVSIKSNLDQLAKAPLYLASDATMYFALVIEVIVCFESFDLHEMAPGLDHQKYSDPQALLAVLTQNLS